MIKVHIFLPCSPLVEIDMTSSDADINSTISKYLCEHEVMAMMFHVKIERGEKKAKHCVLDMLNNADTLRYLVEKYKEEWDGFTEGKQ